MHSRILSDTIVWSNKDQCPVDEETGEHYPEHHQQKETHHVYVKGGIKGSQAFFAWEYFRAARWVRSSVREVIYPNKNTEDVVENEEEINYPDEDCIYVYEVHLTYASPEEQYEEDAYGWSYEDDYDY